MDKKKVFLLTEGLILFFIGPIGLYVWATRAALYFSLYGVTLYALAQMMRQPGFSWAGLWHGETPDRPLRCRMAVAFTVVAVFLTLLTLALIPDKFLGFPLGRPQLWAAVMILYPVLSVLPQELIFRSFFMTRYASLFKDQRWLAVLSGVSFGLSHLPLNNWIAPSFTALGGVIFAIHFLRHRSLKWATIEHSLYGCFVFTIGIGWFFYTGNWRS